MAIGTPVQIGLANSATATASTHIITTSVAHTAGHRIVVCHMGSSSSQVLTGVTDSAGNTYVIDNGVATTRTTWIASSDGANALGSGGQITLTFGTSVNAVRKSIAFSISSVGTRDAAPATVTNTVAGWTTGATGVLAQANEIVFGVCTRGGTVTSAPTAGWTELFDSNSNSSNGTVVYQIVSATTSVNPGGTWSASGTAWRGATASYREATGDQNVNATGIASAEAFGTPTFTTGNVNVSPTGIASAEAFGTPRLDQQVSPSSITSAEAFGVPILSQTNDVFPTGIPSAETFGVVARIDQTVNPVGIASVEAFGTVGRADQEVHPGGILSAEAFGVPTMVGGGGADPGFPTHLPMTGVGR